MAKYNLKIEKNALQDIQGITDWYTIQLQNLGSRFQKQAKFTINSLKTNPHNYAVRYADVHCVGIKKFPFLVHYTIDDEALIVSIFAILHTSRNPKIWETRKNI